MSLRIGGSVLAIWMALGLAFAGVGEADAAPTRASLERSMRELLRGPGRPAGALAVLQRRKQREVIAVGRAQAGKKAPPKARHAMRIASVSKAFSGAVAMRLVREGLLSLDATIGEIRPDLPAAWSDVTLAQLLGHTSGVPDFTGVPAFGDAVGNDPTFGPPPEFLLSFVASEDPVFDPGTDYAYSNSDNIVVGLMAEKVTGMLYPEVLEDLVLGPWGLGRTMLRGGVLMPAPFWRGYTAPPREDVSQVVAFGRWAWASGGIISTPANLTRFIRRYVRLRSGPFFPGGKSDPPGPGSNDAGLAIFRYKTRCGRVFGHTGSILGYTQLIAATGNGRRSLTFSISTQAPPELIPKLRKVQEKAVCYLLKKKPKRKKKR